MPGWIKVVGALGPVLVVISIGVAVFGFIRLRDSLSKQSEQKEDEERQRKEFIAKMQPKVDKIKSS